jgi:hypothetical protein
MVKGEQSRSQLIFGLPFTVYCLPHALRSALSVKGQCKVGFFGSGFFILLNTGDRRLSAYGNHWTILAFAKDVRLQTMFLGFVVDRSSKN